MTTLNRNRQSNGPRERRLRTENSAEETTRRLIESAWKEEARAVLAPEKERTQTATIREVELVSTLRQPRVWDVRTEPRSITLVPRDEIAEKAPVVRKARPARVSHQWEWWQVIAPTAITIGAVWQLIWAIR